MSEVPPTTDQIISTAVSSGAVEMNDDIDSAPYGWYGADYDETSGVLTVTWDGVTPGAVKRVHTLIETERLIAALVRSGLVGEDSETLKDVLCELLDVNEL